MASFPFSRRSAFFSFRFARWKYFTCTLIRTTFSNYIGLSCQRAKEKKTRSGSTYFYDDTLLLPDDGTRRIRARNIRREMYRREKKNFPSRSSPSFPGLKTKHPTPKSRKTSPEDARWSRGTFQPLTTCSHINNKSALVSYVLTRVSCALLRQLFNWETTFGRCVWNKIRRILIKG